MGRSRASKEQLSINGCMPRKNKYLEGGQMHSDGGEVDHWMQDIHPKKHALHHQLHIPEDQKIPTERLRQATHAKSPLLRKRANLALRYRGD